MSKIKEIVRSACEHSDTRPDCRWPLCQCETIPGIVFDTLHQALPWSNPYPRARAIIINIDQLTKLIKELYPRETGDEQ